jgi:alpha-beta hydrolase superfamily lysophospholipase
MTTLKTRDDLTLQLSHWPPATLARGVLVLVHGLGEHAGRYAQVAATLAGDGWSVWGFDQRGHGRSTGARGRMAAADSLLDDLARVIDHARAASEGPLVLLGHSLGGLLAARFVAEALQPAPAAWSRPVDALVLSSPALDAGMSAAQKGLVSLVSALAPDLAVGNGLNPDWVCSDPAVVRAYREDPLVHDRISGRLARFIRDTGPWLLTQAPAWRMPTLLMWAGADRCVAPIGSARFAAAAPAPVVSAHEWPGLSHEIFNEPGRGQVLALLRDWLARR